MNTNFLAVLGMSPAELLIFLTSLGTGVVGFSGAFFAFQSKRDALRVEESRLKREETKAVLLAQQKTEEREYAAIEKREQRQAAIELARITRETAKGVQQSIARKAEEVKMAVEESKKERFTQIEEVKKINLEALDKANHTNDKILALGIERAEKEHPIPVEVTNFPT